MNIRVSACWLGVVALLMLPYADALGAQPPPPRSATPLAVPPQLAPPPPSVASISVAQASQSAVPIQESAAQLPVVTTLVSEIRARTACSPANPTLVTGLLPTSVSQSPPLPIFHFAPASAGLSYIVERAVDGTTTWSLVGSTCGGTPSYLGPGLGTNYMFIDGSGGLVPSTPYVYKLTAYSPTGTTAWISFRWTPPASMPVAVFTNLSHSGSTVSLTTQLYLSGSLLPVQQLLTTTWGYSGLLPLANPAVCSRIQTGGFHADLVCSTQLAAPIGTWSVTVTTQWGLVWDGAMHILAQSAGTGRIVVQP